MRERVDLLLRFGVDLSQQLGQDDLAILGLLEVSAQQFGGGPDEGPEWAVSEQLGLRRGIWDSANVQLETGSKLSGSTVSNVKNLLERLDG